MKRGIILLAILFSSIAGRTQEMDSTKFHLAFNYSHGVVSLLDGSRMDNTYYYSYYNQFSIGVRKEIFDKSNFVGLFITYINRGLRTNLYSGNPFLPDYPLKYNNHFISLQLMGGFYFKKGWYFKENFGLEYIVASDEHDFSQPNSFRGIKRFTPSAELIFGSDINFFPKLNGFIELFFGMNLFKTRYIYFGPKIGFFFKEKEIKTGRYYRSSF